jgi:hypothetical protein
MSLTDTQTQPDRTDTHTAAGVEHVAAPDPAPTIDLTDPAPVRPQFTITEAATACAVSRKTITRKLPDLAEHGAAKDEDGVWRIPVEALLAVGLHPGRSVPERSAAEERPALVIRPDRPPTIPAPSADVVTIPRDRWDDLRIRLARAEAEAAERALALADARLALRALTAGPAAGAAVVPTAAPASLQPPEPAPTADGVLPQPPGTGAPGSAALPGGPDPLAAARSQAAQTGGYVPAAPGAPRRRRWWQSRQA